MLPARQEPVQEEEEESGLSEKEEGTQDVVEETYMGEEWESDHLSQMWHDIGITVLQFEWSTFRVAVMLCWWKCNERCAYWHLQ